MKWRLVLASCSIVLGGVVIQNSAEAANINVTSTALLGACINGNPCSTFNGNDCALQDALDIARCNGQGDTINVAAGTYDADVANSFVYFAANGENFPLTIVGVPGGSIVDGMNNDGCMAINTANATPDDQANVMVSNIIFQNCNLSPGTGGGLAVLATDADVVVDRCIFLSNTASSQGGGLAIQGNGESLQVVSNSLFLGNNSADSDGGGAFVESGQSSITVVNNILARNNAGDGNGGGMYLNASVGNITATNNTFFNNTSVGNGGGLAAQVDDNVSIFDIYNNIVFGNSAESNGDDIWTCEQGATVNLFNNDFLEYYSEALDGDSCGGSATLNQASNIPDNPDFVNSGADDFHLLATSPAIDAGDPAAPSMPSTDFDGNPRPSGAAPDIGALEYQIVPTPTPVPTPIPTPTPIPGTPVVEGSGCSLRTGGTAAPLSSLLVFFGMTGWAVLLRRKLH